MDFETFTWTMKVKVKVKLLSRARLLATPWTAAYQAPPSMGFSRPRRKWQPTPVFLTGESQGQRSLVGCRLWGRTELDTTEVT